MFGRYRESHSGRAETRQQRHAVALPVFVLQDQRGGDAPVLWKFESQPLRQPAVLRDGRRREPQAMRAAEPGAGLNMIFTFVVPNPSSKLVKRIEIEFLQSLQTQPRSGKCEMDSGHFCPSWQPLCAETWHGEEVPILPTVAGLLLKNFSKLPLSRNRIIYYSPILVIFYSIP